MARLKSKFGAKPAGVRWGRVKELTGAHVGSAGFSQYPRRLKHLASWRYLHLLASHRRVHNQGAAVGVLPSSDMSVKQKLKAAANLKQKSKGRKS